MSPLRYLTQAVFPLYILHQTVIVVLAHNLKPLGLAPGLEGPLLIAATFALCLLAYEGIAGSGGCDRCSGSGANRRLGRFPMHDQQLDSLAAAVVVRCEAIGDAHA